jgi:tRNA threonylcarbamoyladenosine biosynthesis protein TsaB
VGANVNILSIETATTVCAIGLRTEHGDVVRTLDTQRRHTEVLTAGIAQLLSESSLVVRDLDRIVVDRGPGLFTGLRVGLATAQAMAVGAGIVLVGANSLELLARSAARAGARGRLVALVDARRGELFAQSFDLSEDPNEVQPVDAAKVTSARALAIIFATHGQAISVTGDGASRYRDEFEVVPSVTLRDEVVPSPSEMLEIGSWRAPSDEVTPLYLREADAVANFSTRERAT